MNILIADDHALFRDSLRSLLEVRGLTVVGEARNGREAVELTRQLKPDVVLMDLSMPEMDGLAATRLISADHPEVKVVVLTASDEDAKLFEAIKSGAQGYLLKNLESGEFFTRRSPRPWRASSCRSSPSRARARFSNTTRTP
jgi:DNA-binding NarL/FixJ family response regulator